ncbi:MAG: hypothetical protein HYZ37_01510 [Candidatus Solibacter usitatus]|nr:hypothetical protein [Candidatus Solibacter usitatus]
MIRTAAVLLLSAMMLPAQKPAYIGAGGCSGSNCHGGTTPAAENASRILTTEYSLWSISDKHSRAAKSLQTPRSKRMAQILGIKDPMIDAKCASCHVAGSPERLRSDGVACEACHGAAEKWLGPHTQPKSHAASLSMGMIDTKDIRQRAKNCLECHLGAAGKTVDHVMIAAGHPDLAFELETFSFAQPAHYRAPRPEAGNTLPGVRMWAIGQAVALGESMRLLAQHAATQWPEFSHLDCSQCHHDLRATSWRIERGYAKRPPGSLQMNLARTAVVRVLASSADLEKTLSRLEGLIATRLGQGKEIGDAATAVAQQADALAARFEKTDFRIADANNMVQALVKDIARISGGGPHAAEQATMSLDALSVSYAQNRDQAAKVLAELYNYLEHPSTYTARDFSALFRKAAARIQ